MQYILRTLLIILAGLLPLPALGQDVPDAGTALYGEWEVVKMVFRTVDQDFKGRPGGWFVFEPGRFIRHFNEEQRKQVMSERVKNVMMWRCDIRQGEIDIWLKTKLSMPPGMPGGEEFPLKASYDLRAGELRIIWSVGERPTDFDEAYKDPQFTLFVLKRVK